MGFTTLLALAFIAGLILAGMGVTIYWMIVVHRYSVECANTLLQQEHDTHAQCIEAEERGSWNTKNTIDLVLAKFREVNIPTEPAPHIPQPDLQPPHELLLAYGVSSVEELPPPLRAIWSKSNDGGDN